MNAIVVGAGPIGLAAAMLLAHDGWEVRVLEKDQQEAPATIDALWANWDRRGVAQFRQPHVAMPRFARELEAELPLVAAQLLSLGARPFNLTAVLPHTLPDRPVQPGDKRFGTIAARRPVIEAAFAVIARETPGLEIIRGVSVEGPVAGSRPGTPVPHVAGVRMSSGERLEADLVIDAMGRRSKFAEWVLALGGRPPYEEATDAGFAYYARHYRSRDGGVPDYRGPFGGPLGTFHALTILGDNDCWTVALVPMARDDPLKSLRYADVWERVARAIPHVAHWLDGEPLTDVLPMAGVLDRYRRFVVDGQPVVTGLVAVGDAWACTNPTAGRGLSMGIRHAIALRDTLRETAGDPSRLAVRLDEVTEATLTPWYRDQVNRDRQRAADMHALVEGRDPDPAKAADPMRQMQVAFLAAAAHDPEIARGWLDTMSCLALPQEVMARPGLAARVMEFVGQSAPHPAAPTRSELLDLVAAPAVN